MGGVASASIGVIATDGDAAINDSPNESTKSMLRVWCFMVVPYSDNRCVVERITVSETTRTKVSSSAVTSGLDTLTTW